MYKILKIVFFSSQNGHDWFFGLGATLVEKWKFRNVVMLYIVRFQIFCWSKIRIEVIIKNKNLKSYNKKCYKYLEVSVQCNIITALKGWEICLPFGVSGVFATCVKRCWVLLKGNKCILRVFSICESRIRLFSRGIKCPSYFS